MSGTVNDSQHCWSVFPMLSKSQNREREQNLEMDRSCSSVINVHEPTGILHSTLVDVSGEYSDRRDSLSLQNKTCTVTPQA